MIIEAVDFDFDAADFHVIIGDNGAGKSAMLDALALILFENKRADQYREYVRYGTDQAKLELDADFNGSVINFKITINGASNKLPLERKMTFQKKEYVNSEITTFLNENFDLAVIENVMFSMQKEDSNISKLSPSQRRDLFKNMFNITFEEESKVITSNISTLQNEVVSYTTELNILKNKKFTPTAPYEVLDSEVVKKTKEHIVLQREEVNVLKSYKSAQDSYIRLDRNRKQIKDLQVEIEKHQAKIDAVRSDDALNPDVGMAIMVKINDLEHDLDHVQKDNANYNSKIVDYKMQIAEKVSELKTEREHEQDHKDGRCIRCGHPISESENTEWENKIDFLESLILSLRQSLANEEEFLNKSQEKLKKLKIQLSTETLAKSKFDTRVSESLQLQSFSSFAIKTNNETIKNLMVDVREMERDLPVIPDSFDSNSISEKERSIQKLEKILSERDILVGQNKTIEENNKRLLLEEKAVSDKIDDLVKKINRCNMDITSNEQALNILTVDLVNYSIVKTCNLLEDYINEFIETIKSDLKIKLIKTKKGIDLYYTPISAISTEVDNWSSVKMASGFEQDLVNLAFKIALAKAYNLKVLVLDEIDSASTENNSYKLFSLIAKISDYDQVIIISHKPEVQKILADECSSVICYRVENGVYTIEE